jgi:nucleoside-diphosphate-sugar epimerase
LRFFNVYGSGQSDEYAGVTTKFKSRILQNLPPLISGNGNQQRDFVSVHDVVESIICALQPPASITNGVFNVGTGVPTSISELSILMARILNQKSIPTFLEKNKGDIQISYADIKRARSDLNFVARMDLVSGLRELLSNA